MEHACTPLFLGQNILEDHVNLMSVDCSQRKRKEMREKQMHTPEPRKRMSNIPSRIFPSKVYCCFPSKENLSKETSLSHTPRRHGSHFCFVQWYAITVRCSVLEGWTFFLGSHAAAAFGKRGGNFPAAFQLLPLATGTMKTKCSKGEVGKERISPKMVLLSLRTSFQTTQNPSGWSENRFNEAGDGEKRKHPRVADESQKRMPIKQETGGKGIFLTPSILFRIGLLFLGQFIESKRCLPQPRQSALPSPTSLLKSLLSS